jgi:hypothetical protein
MRCNASTSWRPPFGLGVAELLLLLGERAARSLELAFLLVDEIEFLVEQVGPFTSRLSRSRDRGIASVSASALPDSGLPRGARARLAADGLPLAVGVGDDLLGEPARSELQSREEVAAAPKHEQSDQAN